MVGTEEPIYGPSALRSVAEDAKTTPYTELTRNDMKWECLNQTNVETQTFYIFTESGHMVLVQVIYSNVVYVWPRLAWCSRASPSGLLSIR